MVKHMKNVNHYYKGYKESDSKINYIKYGLLNEFGYNIDSNPKEEYNEEKIIKKICKKN